MVGTVAPALRVLCEGLIDYAGLFPPTALPLEEARAKYAAYRRGDHAWMLRRFVVDASRADLLPAEWPLAVLATEDHVRASVIESKQVVRLPKPAYCEVSSKELPEVKRAGGFAKLRCVGVSTEEIAEFLRRCHELQLALKFTAGLHHPVRTGNAHGFVNVFTAAVLLHSGVDAVEQVLEDTDAAHFTWTDTLVWQDHVLTSEEIENGRRSFAHSFGSCSFEEPIEGLVRLGWL